MNKKTSKTLTLAGKTLVLETGEFATQASASVLARLGDTMVLATLVVGEAREDIDYFPLTVEYAERLYAGGKIKGSRWVKREGRPSDDAILSARLIDRSIRPLFPKEFKKEVQIVVTMLSVDGENEPDILGIIATSAALAISTVPWNGPIGATRIGAVRDNGNWDFLVNPGLIQQETSELDLVASQTKEKTIMLEAGARQVPEEAILSAIERAQTENTKIIEFIEEFAKEAGTAKEKVSPNPEYLSLLARIEKSYKKEILDLMERRVKKESGESVKQLVDKIFEEELITNPEVKIDKKSIGKAIESVMFKSIKEEILSKKKRPDGRGPDDLREIECRVSVLPRTHGSAVFRRGNTQALTIATLGSPRLEQLIESAEGEESKRYIHHYSMPPYSVGETGRIGFPSRREIGHGALAERALLAVIPQHMKFPYTIRVVSEVLSSNGSTSMASTCGSTLALMDAGVPITAPVSGISIGMMSSGDDEYVLLTDISGLEDFSGDMDFKAAGTEAGITAIQLDVKTEITISQIKEALEKAKKARLLILEKMLAAIPSSKEEVSQYAPKIEVIKIPIEKIGELIGPGGRMIKHIIAETGAEVDVNDDGEVTISGALEEQVKNASAFIKALTREVKVGEEFEGEVKRILPFGAFVEILPGKEGMVHVSKMSSEFVKNPNDVVSIGDRVKVKVVEIDEQRRINLSMVMSASLERPREDRGDEKKEAHPLVRQLRRENDGQRGRPSFKRSRR